MEMDAVIKHMLQKYIKGNNQVQMQNRTTHNMFVQHIASSKCYFHGIKIICCAADI